MKTCFLLSTLLVGASSFAVVPQTVSRSQTALAALLPEDEMSADQLEILKIQEKWAEVRHLSKDEAEAQLEGDWLEAYNRFYTKYNDDMEKMTEIANMLQKSTPKVEKKSKGQKRRDKWALVQAREAARAAAK